MSMLTKLIGLVGSDSLDQVVKPVMMLVYTLRSYPAGRQLETRADLEAFLADDARIRLSLAVAVDHVAALPIWSDAGDLADLPSDCRDGLTAWFCDLRKLAALHAHYGNELATAASEAATLALHNASSPELAGSGACDHPSQVPEPGGSFCMCCGEPATEEVAGMPLCAACLAGAFEQAAEMVGKAAKP